MSAAAPAAPAAPPTRPESANPRRSPWRRALGPLSSLRLTVGLLACGVIIVFIGTLAQTEDGLYVAQQRYFRSWFAVWAPQTQALSWIRLPMPGGYLLGTLLVANLVAAHAARFKLTWRKSGIFLTHLGIILLLLGQLATDMMARESRLSFSVGEWRNYSEDFQECELVFLKDAPDPTMDEAVVIPESLLRPGHEFRNERLPVTVRVERHAENSLVRVRAPMVDTNTPPASSAGAGARAVMEPLPPTRKMDERNLPAVIVALADANGRSLGDWLFSLDVREQTIATPSGPLRAILRPRRYYQPFSLKLLQTTHDVFPGSDIPKNYRSRVQIDRPGAGRREVDIYMNSPLRYGGLTFYQFGMPGPEARERAEWSVLQVVKNPSWLTPYLACGMVAGGLVAQFGIHLSGFLKRRKPAAA